MGQVNRLPTVDADRVRLRWLTEADVPALFDIFSDPEVTRYWSFPALADREAAAALLAEIHDYFRQGTLYQWGVALQDSDLVVGTCTLASIDLQNRRAEIGFALHRGYWKQGLISEALVALLHHAFEDLKLHRIEADVDPRNAASLRLLERFGFEREGYLRERWIVDGEVTDTVFYGLLESDWRSRHHGR